MSQDQATTPDILRRIDLPNVPTFEIEVHQALDLHISTAIREYLAWEPFETQLVAALLEPGATFLDIGANIGWFSLVGGLLVGIDGRGWAFEPESRNHQLLVRNLRRNGLRQVQAERLAATAEHGTMELFLSPDNLGDHRVQASLDEPDRPRQEVQGVPLDDYLEPHPESLDFVKIDCQGFEPAVLAGLRQRLARDRPTMLLEFWPHGLGDEGLEAMFSILARLPGSIFEVDVPAEALRPSDGPRLRKRAATDLHPSSGGHIDLLTTVRPDHLASIRHFIQPD